MAGIVLIFVVALLLVRTDSTRRFPEREECEDVIVQCVHQHPGLDNYTVFHALDMFQTPWAMEELCRLNDAVEDCAARQYCFSHYHFSRYRFFSKTCQPHIQQINFYNQQRRRCWRHPFALEARACYRAYGYPEPETLPLFPNPAVMWELQCFPSLDYECRIHASFKIYNWVRSRDT